MPRSLNEPVGFIPSNFTKTLAPVRAESARRREQRRAALAERDDRRRVGDVEPVRVLADDSAPLMRRRALRTVMSRLSSYVAFDAEHAGHGLDLGRSAQGRHDGRRAPPPAPDACRSPG